MFVVQWTLVECDGRRRCGDDASGLRVARARRSRRIDERDEARARLCNKICERLHHKTASREIDSRDDETPELGTEKDDCERLRRDLFPRSLRVVAKQNEAPRCAGENARSLAK